MAIAITINAVVELLISLVNPMAAKIESKENTKFIKTILVITALDDFFRLSRRLNRDRFILSAGHGSMFIYSWLHLAGYAVSLEDVKSFRKLHSITPGHPEYEETPGVEATTGPLGQGVGNAVGFALSGKHAAAKFNTADHTIFDNHVVALLGDGCLQEGIS